MIGSRQSCVEIGIKLAEKIFAKRSGQLEFPRVEVHVSKEELAAMLAIAAESGFNLGRKHWYK